MIVVLDTQILIWGGIRESENLNGVERELLQRTAWLLDYLEDIRAKIIIPTIVAAELSVPLPAPKRDDFMARLSERFILKPFDVHAASVAADLFASVMADHTSAPATRRVLSADVKIVATAKSARVTKFYSHDRGCLRIAHLAGLDAYDLPEHSGLLPYNESSQSTPMHAREGLGRR